MIDAYGNHGHVTRHIFVTGGVVSSLGKGLTASSLGRLLRSRGLSVAMQKLDPYINVDPGTMNPFQHGEVFVTEDGAETDLDIGHYERFLDVNLSGKANANTVQVIPHITDEIKRVMRAQAEPDSDGNAPDVIITEIGGTVGDIESQPFLEAARQVRADIGRANVAFVHVSLIPFLPAAGELKTKPTQHSVAALRNIGIMCDVEREAVIECKDAASIYEVPPTLHREGLDAFLVQRLGLTFRDVDWREWNALLERVHSPKNRVEVALVGKYVDLHDAYLSVSEAIKHGGFANNAHVDIRWVASDQCETPNGAQLALAGVDAIVVPGGFGVRGIEGKLGALRWAREHGVPTLGICLGLQCMVIEAARNLLGLKAAASTEMESETPDPVVTTMNSQREFVEGEGDLGGTMRLGAYPAKLTAGSVVAQAYGTCEVSERHRHRYEVNNDYRERLESVGLHVCGTSPDGSLVEFVELDSKLHPYYVATQAHPEFKSRPTKAHPLFAGLVKAALARRSEVFASPKAHSLPREASLQAREGAAAKNGEER